MLVDLGLVEQRYNAVSEVLNDGATVTDVARRHGVGRQRAPLQRLGVSFPDPLVFTGRRRRADRRPIVRYRPQVTYPTVTTPA